MPQYDQAGVRVNANSNGSGSESLSFSQHNYKRNGHSTSFGLRVNEYHAPTRYNTNSYPINNSYGNNNYPSAVGADYSRPNWGGGDNNHGVGDDTRRMGDDDYKHAKAYLESMRNAQTAGSAGERDFWLDAARNELEGFRRKPPEGDDKIHLPNGSIEIDTPAGPYTQHWSEDDRSGNAFELMDRTSREMAGYQRGLFGDKRVAQGFGRPMDVENKDSRERMGYTPFQDEDYRGGYNPTWAAQYRQQLSPEAGGPANAQGNDAGQGAAAGPAFTPAGPSYTLDANDPASADFTKLAPEGQFAAYMNAPSITGADGKPLSQAARFTAGMTILNNELGNFTSATGMAIASGKTPEERLALANKIQDPAQRESAVFMLSVQSDLQGPVLANMQALYASSSAEEKAQLDKLLDTTVETANKNIPGSGDQLRTQLDLIKHPPTTQQAAATAADLAARNAALDTVKFDDTDDGKKAAATYEAILKQDKAMHEAGGPFMAFFVKLFSMIGNMMSGHPEYNQSPEDFLADPANAAHLNMAQADRDALNAVLTKENKAPVPAGTATAPAAGDTPGAEQGANGNAPAAGTTPPTPNGAAADAAAAQKALDAVLAQNPTIAAAGTAPVTQTKAEVKARQDIYATLGFDKLGFPISSTGNDLTKTHAITAEIEKDLGMSVTDGTYNAEVAAALKNPDAIKAIQQLNAAKASTAQAHAGDPPAQTTGGKAAGQGQGAAVGS